MSARGKTLGFVGAGRVGTALAVKLAEAGYRVAAVSDINTASACVLADVIEGCSAVPTAQDAAGAADLVFITTSDDEIGAVCRSVVWNARHAVVHCSGAVSTDVLSSAAGQGAQVGSFHPCQAFADAAQALRNLPGSTFAVEADQPLAGILENMASDLACGHIRLGPGDKAIYHAAAVFASNYIVTLLKAGTDLFSGMGIPHDQAIKILMPLVKGNLFNIEQAGIPGCLTGPIARGDSGTVRKHVQAIRRRFPEYLDLYARLGLHTLHIAAEKGCISEETAAALKGVLEGAPDIGTVPGQEF